MIQSWRIQKISGHSWKDESFVPENVLKFNNNNYPREATDRVNL